MSQSVPVKTKFGSLQNYQKGNIDLVKGDARHYVFSNVFEVASMSKPYEKVIVGLNLGYVIETMRAEGQSPWFTCAHDEFVICMDGEVRIDFIKLDHPLVSGEGTHSVDGEPKGNVMGYVIIKHGHQALLPAGSAYRFNSPQPGVLLQQTIKGPLSVEKWEQICIK